MQILEDAKSAKNEVDVSEHEMAKHYASTVGETVGRKFATKRSIAGQTLPVQPAIQVTSRPYLYWVNFKFLQCNYVL